LPCILGGAGLADAQVRGEAGGEAGQVVAVGAGCLQGRLQPDQVFPGLALIRNAAQVIRLIGTTDPNV
jgi:hypothetical protein